MDNNRILILGAGESGTGAALLAKTKGFDVFVSDCNEIKASYKNVLLKNNIEFEELGHSKCYDMFFDEIIKSPGISELTNVVGYYVKQEINIISEIEFASRYTNAKLICVTGSNGKSTTSKLIWHILRKAGINAGLAGNIGNSFARQIVEKKFDVYVLEISSFQLEGMFEFRADVAVLLNITVDHLDRYHESFEEYARTKYKIVQNQKSRDFFIYNIDDEVIVRLLAQHPVASKEIPLSVKKELRSSESAWVDEKYINYSLNNTHSKIPMDDFALVGKHNQYNNLAATIVSKTFEITDSVIRESLMDFTSLEHRLEKVTNINGIDYINDSKATNVNSTYYALDTYEEPIIWIAGGQDKGNDYADILPLVSQKVKMIICLGKDNDKIVDTFSGLVDEIVQTTSVNDAVRFAYENGDSGDVVLLSPACASFDLFENFEDRGTQFKEAVKKL